MRVPNLEEALWPDGSHPTTSSPRTTQDFRTCPHAEQVVYGIRYLAWARAFAVGHTSRLGLPSERLEDLALAVGELATNSIRHGGYGLLVVNDLADLVRTHTGPAGTAIRLHFLVLWSSPTAYDGPVETSSTAAA